MTLYQAYRQYLDSKRPAKAIELEVIKISLQALNQKLEALDTKLQASQTSKLEKDLNVLKATVDKISSRLVGFSKTGIS